MGFLRRLGHDGQLVGPGYRRCQRIGVCDRYDFGRFDGSVALTVAQEVDTVMVIPAVVSVVAGDTVRLTAIQADANANEVLSAPPPAWSTSSMMFATVDSASLVTGIEGGPAVITATSSNGKSGTAMLTVTGGFPAIPMQVGRAARAEATFERAGDPTRP